jgi:hypothetical protein
MAIVLLLLALLSGSAPHNMDDDPCTGSSCIFQQGGGTGG